MNSNPAIELEIIRTLLKNLKVAFSPRKIPSSISDGCERKICQYLEAEFQMKNREDLTIKQIGILSSEMTLLNYEALCYFIPVILTEALQNPTAIDLEMVFQNLIMYPGLNDFKKYSQHRLNQFTIAEADIIQKILTFWSENKRIAPYWQEEIKKSLPFWKKKAKR